MTVTHENFQEAADMVKAGGRMLILAYGRPVIITSRVWLSWSSSGRRPVFPSKDGKGFVVRRGRTTEYVLPGLLVVERKGE